MRTTGSTTRTRAIAKAARWRRWPGSGENDGDQTGCAIQPRWDRIEPTSLVGRAPLEVQHNLGTLFAAYGRRSGQTRLAGRQAQGRGIRNVSIDHMASRSAPLASISGPWHQGLVPDSGR